MAINQPPITGDPVVDAWMLEVTRELNRGETQQTSPPQFLLLLMLMILYKIISYK